MRLTHVQGVALDTAEIQHKVACGACGKRFSMHNILHSFFKVRIVLDINQTCFRILVSRCEGKQWYTQTSIGSLRLSQIREHLQSNTKSVPCHDPRKNMGGQHPFSPPLLWQSRAGGVPPTNAGLCTEV